MEKKPTLQQKIKQIRKLDCLLSIVSTITILGTIILLTLAFTFKQYFAGFYISGCVCLVVMVLVNHFQTITIHKENFLQIKQFEEDYYKKD